MIYLYFDKDNGMLYAFDSLAAMSMVMTSHIRRHQAHWNEIEAVTADWERHQILAHGKLGVGIVAEFPIAKTVLTCKKPE